MNGRSIAALERSVQIQESILRALSEKDCLVGRSRDHQDERQMG